MFKTLALLTAGSIGAYALYQLSQNPFSPKLRRRPSAFSLRQLVDLTRNSGC